MAIYYVGLRESDISNINTFAGSVTYFGSNKNDNHSLNGTFKKAINHNKPEYDHIFNEFAKDWVTKISKKDTEARFMYYNLNYLHIHKSLFSFADICSNEKQVVANLNDKFYTRKLLKGIANLLVYKTLLGKDVCLSKLKKLFGGEEEFVVQQCSGAGGEGTYIFNAENEQQILTKLKSDREYQVSKYVANNSINIHLLITKDKIVLFPCSVQIIKNVTILWHIVAEIILHIMIIFPKT